MKLLPILIGMSAAMLACSKKETPAADTHAAAPAATLPKAAPGSCPATGQWARCSILERLERAGLAPRVDSEPATEKRLAQKGILVHVGRRDLELFIYPDSNARAAAEKKLDRADYVEAYAEPGINQEPTLIRSVNLLAILKSINGRQRERVSDAITAGPPQPVS